MTSKSFIVLFAAQAMAAGWACRPASLAGDADGADATSDGDEAAADGGDTAGGDGDSSTLSLEKLHCGMSPAKGPKTLFQACDQDAECSTGFCLDEPVLRALGYGKFCTAQCKGCPSVVECDTFAGSADIDATCNNLNKIDMTGLPGGKETKVVVEDICVPKCSSGAKCAGWFPGLYSTCDRWDLDGDGIKYGQETCMP